jgi:hypothetical protein
MSDREQNVGRIDRIVRAILGTVGIALMAWLYLTAPLNTGSIAAMIVLAGFEIIFLVGAVTGTCGVYAAFGIDTCKCESDSPVVTWV